MSSDPTSRLRLHPQVRQTYIKSYEPRTFACLRCEAEFYLRGARPLADGTLVCPRCFVEADAHDLRWCAKCEQMLPSEEFALDEFAQKLSRSLGAPQRWHKACRACRTPERPDRTRACDHCGESFTPMRDHARFCSGRCRVAAHRKATA